MRAAHRPTIPHLPPHLLPAAEGLQCGLCREPRSRHAPLPSVRAVTVCPAVRLRHAGTKTWPGAYRRGHPPLPHFGQDSSPAPFFFIRCFFSDGPLLLTGVPPMPRYSRPLGRRSIVIERGWHMRQWQ